MKSIGELYQSGDWKGEKHVPVIHVKQCEENNQKVAVKVVIGEEISHPNTHEHHISWVKLYFKPENSNFPVEVGTAEFNAHGELGVATDYCAKFKFQTENSGTLYATSYCNIHGLWENTEEIAIG